MKQASWIGLVVTLIGAPAYAQDTTFGGTADTSGSVSAGGDTAASTTYTAPPPSSGDSGSGSSSDGGIRLAGQYRLDVLNLVNDVGGLPATATPLIPTLSAGIRILENRLFIGAGIGFGGVSQDTGPGDRSQFAFGFGPLATFDFITSEYAAVYGLGSFTIVSVGESTTETPAGDVDGNDDVTGIGLSFGAGIRGKLNESLAIGTEMGWGFVSLGGAPDQFDHGMWAALSFEASIGL